MISVWKTHKSLVVQGVRFALKFFAGETGTKFGERRFAFEGLKVTPVSTFPGFPLA
jgi:hypothetical protein